MSDARGHPYAGRGVLPDQEAASLGFKVLPDCNHMWRTVGQCAEEITSYGVDIGEADSTSEICSLGNKGGDVFRQSAGLYPALVNLQECEMRSRHDQIEFAHENRAMITGPASRNSGNS